MPTLDGIQFRPIQPDDQPFLSRLYASTRQDELSTLEWDEERKQIFLLSQFEAQHRFYQETFKEARFQLILQQGRPIGRLYLEEREDEIRLIDIALTPEVRNQGIGGALMRDILEQGRSLGKAVRIHVERFNPARRLYDRLGFREIEDKGVHILMEWTPPSK